MEIILVLLIVAILNGAVAYIDEMLQELVPMTLYADRYMLAANGGSMVDVLFDILCFLQALFGEKCKIFLENVASPNWRKLQGLGWQLFCQLHSHCRPYLVVIA